MADARTFVERLRNGLARIDAEAEGAREADALKTLRRSVELTLSRLETGVESARFRFQNTGGKPLLFQGNEALPMEPGRLFSLLNAMEIVLQPGEALDLDGGMAAWLIRPEVNETDSDLRQAEEHLKLLKLNRDRDHGATQAADSARIRLRSRLTQLVGALQMANSPSAGPLPAAKADREPALPPPAPKQETAVRPPPPPPAPKQETAVRPAPPPPPPPAEPAPPPPAPARKEETLTAEVLGKALRKIGAAIQGLGFKSAVIGDVAHLSWGSRMPVRGIEILLAIGQTQRDTMLSAARREGLFPASGRGPLSLRFIDPKLGMTVDAELIETTLPYHREIIARAKPDFVLGTELRVASCEDLIVLRARSKEPGHRESIIELLRACANRIDSGYLKRAAQAFGVLDRLKSAWQESKTSSESPADASGA
jgi:hypothetical protein